MNQYGKMDKQEIADLLRTIAADEQLKRQLLELLIGTLDLRVNQFHPFVFVGGKPEIGRDVGIGLFSEVNAKGGRIAIGDACDIASFVSINICDSHKKCLGMSSEIEKKEIVLENNVFIGSHSFIGGGTHIGHHSVIGAGTIIKNAGYIPPYSLIVGNPVEIKKGYYAI